MATADYVAATGITVTVIDFGKSGAQVGIDTITFSGPFAAGQVFTGEPESTNGDTYSCGIASVSSDAPLTYDNLSPVPGGAR
ncbi:MAG TPA: hypothetical protein VFX25_27950 [Streptosporangiaceae bacterium]|nr:hypothetical protein [Streptosporangiaceae bacterium]